MADMNVGYLVDKIVRFQRFEDIRVNPGIRVSSSSFRRHTSILNIASYINKNLNSARKLSEIELMKRENGGNG